MQFQADVQMTCRITQPLQYLWKIVPYSEASGTVIPLKQETLQVDYYKFNPALADFGKYVAELTVSLSFVSSYLMNVIMAKLTYKFAPEQGYIPC